MTLSISKNDICSYLIHYHSLDNFYSLSGKSGVKNIFKRIGSIQYDPLNVVGRNPNLVLQSRIKGFTDDILDKLLYKDRYLVDAWDKEMSIYRTEDWNYFNRVRTCKDVSYKGVLARRGQTEALSYIKKVIKEFKDRGHLEAKDIDFGKCKSNRWGHKNISGAALDYLFSIGKLGVYERKNVIKIYDLIENLIPQKYINAKEPFNNDMEFFEWYILRRIGSIGIHWLRNGLGWNGYFINDKKLRMEIFKVLEKKGLIIKINIPEINEEFYIRKQDMKYLNKKPDYDNNIRLLAPLDNMIWDRLMVYKLFDFQYSWEVYLPIEKRKYGYYVLPVLYQNKLIARMEPQKHEIGKPFFIKNWWWEPKTIINNKLKSAIKNGLKTFSEYLDADGIDKTSLERIYK
jgi:uncharacterized protein YcaQ